MNIKQIAEQIEQEKKDVVMRLEEVSDSKEKNFNFTRYKTGIFPLDRVLNLKRSDKGGLAGGDIVIIAAPTGNGKTTMAQTLSFQLLREEGLPSLWFTYEVNAYNLWQSFKEMGVKGDDLLCCPLEHTSGDIDWIHKKIREAKVSHMAKVIVIDHLGFLTPSQKMNSNMNSNYSIFITQIVRSLKKIAVEENVIILLPAHMVKSASSDPTLKDIGHSGGIAQEADVVILMAREEDESPSAENYYTPYTKVIMAKNRIGGETPSWWMEKHEGRLIETNKPYGKSNAI